MRKNLIIIVLIALLAGVAGWLLRARLVSVGSRTETQVSAVVDRIKAVSKLVTVEGHLSEIYSYKDAVPLFWYLPLYSEKKILLKVEAKVLAGVDLSRMGYEIDGATRTVTITHLPAPEIMAVDDKISYYDITEGYWNSFSEHDLDTIQQSAKDYVRQLAQTSEIPAQARRRALDVLAQADELLGLYGWHLVVVDSADVSGPAL